MAKIALSELELSNKALHGRFRTSNNLKKTPKHLGVFFCQNACNIATMPIMSGR